MWKGQDDGSVDDDGRTLLGRDLVPSTKTVTGKEGEKGHRREEICYLHH